MVLDQDPAKVIQSFTSNFRIESDKACLERIKGSLDTLSQARSMRIDQLHEDLTRLGRHLALAQNQQRSTAAETGVVIPVDKTGKEDFTSSDVAIQLSERHTDELNRLDTDKYRIAKQADELEIEGDRLERELEGLRVRLNDLEIQDDDDYVDINGQEDSDETVLKLKIYRSLGIDVESPDPITGQYTKAVIRNPFRGDVHVVNIDSKFSRYFYANYFWQTLG